MKTTFLLLLLFLPLVSFAQEIIHIPIQTEPTHIKIPPTRLGLMTFTYQSDTLIFQNKKYGITPPHKLEAEEGAYAFLNYQGNHKKDVPQGALLFLDGYQDRQSRVYVDRNFNLDFNDDGAPLLLKDSMDIATIHLNHPEVPEAVYVVDIQFMQYKHEQQKQMIKAYAQEMDEHPVFGGNTLNDPDYWLTETRKNYLVFNVFLAGDSVKMALMDYNADGLYDGAGEDAILLGNDQTNSIENKDGENTFLISEKTVIKVKDQFYQVVDLDPAGKYITLLSTSQTAFDATNPYHLEKGAKVPDLTFMTLKGKSSSLYQSLSEEKYNLIDFWGTWCKGCVMQTDSLMQLHSQYQDKLHIIGMNSGDKPQKAAEYVRKKGIKWEQGVATEEMLQQLSIQGFPFYMLVDQDMKILAIDLRLKDVEVMLNKD